MFVISLYPLIPLYRWSRAITHRDFHGLNPLLFQFVSGIANRKELWITTIGGFLLSIPMLVILSAPGLLTIIGLSIEYFPVAKALGILLGCVGMLMAIPSSIAFENQRST